MMILAMAFLPSHIKRRLGLGYKVLPADDDISEAFSFRVYVKRRFGFGL
jgi:hypothetical protein